VKDKHHVIHNPSPFYEGCFDQSIHIHLFKKCFCYGT
jgi:hypothetical protein